MKSQNQYAPQQLQTAELAGLGQLSSSAILSVLLDYHVHN